MNAYRLVRRPVEVTAPRLSEPQSRVVGHRAGPLLVLGGPGTGKTTTLVEAVAARLAEGERDLLVLTFSRRAAARLRTRIVARLGAGAHPLSVRTFHGYAFGLLRRLAAGRGEPPPRLLNGPEQDLVIRDLLAGDSGVGWPASLRPALRTRGFAAELRDLLLRAAERDVSPERLAELGRECGREDWVAAGRFARQYADVLALRDATTRDSVGYDTAELIRAAAGQLAGDPAAHAGERARCRYVYVDELHDVDPAQWDLLELVAGGGGTLVGFGDPDSSIFGFRGADPRALLAMPQRFPTVAGRPAPEVRLTTCWRSTPALVEAAGAVARRLRGPSRHRVRTAPGGTPVNGGGHGGRASEAGTADGGRHVAGFDQSNGDRRADGRGGGGPDGVEVRLLRSASEEAAYLAQRLRAAHLLDGVAWSSMAVLLRASSQLAPVRRALLHAGVPVRVGADDLPLSAQPAVAPLLLLLRCALHPEQLDEENAVALLQSPLGGADPFAERKLRQGLRGLALAAASGGGEVPPSGELLVEALRDPAALAAVEQRWAEPAHRVAELLRVARDALGQGAEAGPPTGLAGGAAGTGDAVPGGETAATDRAGLAAGAEGAGLAAGTAPEGGAEGVLWAVWRASGLAERWAAASAAGGHRGAAADRDLDAVLALFDAAARFTDRLPGAGLGAFLEHVLGQQIPADSLAPTAERGEAVRLLTVHSAKGLEWDLVAVPGVQEGRWPDLRLRGSVLGSEQLVDVVAGRADERAGRVTALLDEERRLFYVAATRARGQLVVTAVASGDDEEQPSRFLDELTPTPPGAPLQTDAPAHAEPDRADVPALLNVGGGAGSDAAPAGSPPAEPERAGGSSPAPGAALTLPVLVARLRTVVETETQPVRRRAAARQLARLAHAGVPGAHPDQWWGLRPLSDPGPLAGPGEPVTVSPSAVDQVQRCGLRWLLERHGGSKPPGPEMTVGNLVHAAAERVDELGEPELYRYLDEHWGVVEVAARWERGRKREQAEQMIERLVRWLAANPRRLVATEQPFSVTLPGTGVELRGTVDRLERDADGRLVVIDFKTGKTIPKNADVDRYPQLGTYQLAVALGGFAELTDDTRAARAGEAAPAAGEPDPRPAHPTEPGGAALVQLGRDRRDGPEQSQAALAADPDPGWAETTVRAAAEAMSGESFTARVNPYCAVCSVQTSCTLSGHGRQLIESDPGSPR